MMPRPKSSSLSVVDKVAMLWIIWASVGKAIIVLLTGVFISKQQRPASYFRHVIYTAMRTASGMVTTDQEQWFYVDTTETYIDWCKSRGITPSTETLPDGTKAHWIRNREADNVLIHFHGGGFNATARPEYFDFLSSAMGSLNERTRSASFAVLFLAYDVAPYARYPYQLRQAIELVSHVIKGHQFRPENILLGGDSAGANLTLALLGHVMHPHPDPVVPKLEWREGESFRGALLISPWVNFLHTAPSFRRNQYKDCISVATLDRWSRNYLGDVSGDPYNQPLTAPAGWWNDLGATVKKLFIVGGSDEIMLDDILTLSETLKREWNGVEGGVETVITEGEAHVSVMIDRGIGYKPEDLQMDKEIRRWLRENL